jgi:hypothetical protein
VIPVEQTKFGKDGNCFRACIASIFELRLEDVPECDGGRWNGALYNWFTERNLAVCNRYFKEGEPCRINEMGYGILTAKSPRTEGYHAVVIYQGKTVFDPHPERETGVGDWWFYTHFYVLDPSRLTLK